MKSTARRQSPTTEAAHAPAPAPAPAPVIRVEARGPMPPESSAYARAKVLAVTARIGQHVLSGRVRLTRVANPGMARPALAQVNLNVNGKPVRVHVAAETMREAIDLLQDRLAARLARVSGQADAHRGRTPAHRPGDDARRPVGERAIVRHKSFTLAQETPEEAAYEMELMDYGFHLFTDAASGQDSVLYRTDPAGCRLAQVRPAPGAPGPEAARMTVSELPAPRLTVAEARGRLEMTGYPFVFFADEATGRGNVLYHRHDGHYGLITPAG